MAGQCTKNRIGLDHAWFLVDDRTFVCLYCEQERASVRVVTLEVKEEFL
jgi:hypothetical protein